MSKQTKQPTFLVRLSAPWWHILNKRRVNQKIRFKSLVERALSKTYLGSKNIKKGNILGRNSEGALEITKEHGI